MENLTVNEVASVVRETIEGTEAESNMLVLVRKARAALGRLLIQKDINVVDAIAAVDLYSDKMNQAVFSSLEVDRVGSLAAMAKGTYFNHIVKPATHVAVLAEVVSFVTQAI